MCLLIGPILIIYHIMVGGLFSADIQIKNTLCSVIRLERIIYVYVYPTYVALVGVLRSSAVGEQFS